VVAFVRTTCGTIALLVWAGLSLYASISTKRPLACLNAPACWQSACRRTARAAVPQKAWRACAALLRRWRSRLNGVRYLPAGGARGVDADGNFFISVLARIVPSNSSLGAKSAGVAYTPTPRA